MNNKIEIKTNNSAKNECSKWGGVRLLSSFVEKRIGVITCALLLGVMVMGVAQAGNTGDALWNTISTLIGTWVTRLGAVVMFVGGIMFGLGWKSDDAEQKSRGISTIISGAIVTALAAMVGTFFA